ncbi:MAG: tetratricopeptide repeat protein [Phycisphaerae bacterium]|nr:tetratricopeptide repeat protein [Phycisphaerae bacterium]MCZ2399749.1 tetratricopeptide repeat protein [Phycisphaerae bacterium]
MTAFARRVLLMWLLAAAPAVSLAHSTLSPQRQREIVEQALDAYDQAVELSAQDPRAAEALFRRAAEHFRALRESGVRNASLEYNLGNTYYRLGDLGRSVASYRRAQRLAPTHADTAANLEFVRRRVRPEIVPSGERRLVERLLFWQYGTSLVQRWWACLAFSVAGWGGLTVWLLRRRAWLATASLACVVLGVANAGLVAWQLREESLHPEAVVVRGEPLLRSGRGEGAEPVLREPLGPGVELRILDRRGDWLRVELRDQQTGWLPADVVERV